MLSSTQNVAPKPLQPALPPAAQSTPPAQAGGPSFAQFMTEQASLPPPPAQPDAPAEQPEAAAEAAPASPAHTATRRAAQAPKPATPQRAADGAPKTEAKADAKATQADKTEAQAADVVAAASEDDAPGTPELKEFTQLIGLTTAGQPDPAAAAKPDLQRGRGTPPAGDDPAAGRSATRAAGADAGRAADAPGAAAHAKAAELHADKADARAAASELLQAATASTPPEAAPAAATPSFAAALAQAMPAPANGASSAPPPADAAVRAPLHSPDFAPELGTRVSLLAVDGVQQAELQLNPADMGPVSVQITVDGSQAQVSFHAAQAETRQALEQSLPELAAALQGQGLTLSGGGVFQQAARDKDHGQQAQGGEGADRGTRRGAGPVGATAAGAATPPRRTVGLLDTFA
jgi:flagellar hook-length control protein FliK